MKSQLDFILIQHLWFETNNNLIKLDIIQHDLTFWTSHVKFFFRLSIWNGIFGVDSFWFWKKLFKKIRHCFSIRYTNQIESGQPFSFACKTNPFLKLNNVKYCPIMDILRHFWPFLHVFCTIWHKQTKKRIIIFFDSTFLI